MDADFVDVVVVVITNDPQANHAQAEMNFSE